MLIVRYVKLGYWAEPSEIGVYQYNISPLKTFMFVRYRKKLPSDPQGREKWHWKDAD